MRLKLYNAATMAEAMACVRAELGTEALILSTRRVAGGVEVTAALEPQPLAMDDVLPAGPQAHPRRQPSPGPLQHQPPDHPSQQGRTEPAVGEATPRPPRQNGHDADAAGFVRGRMAARIGGETRPLSQSHRADNSAERRRRDAAREAAFAFHGLPPAVARRLSGGPLAFAIAAAFRFVPVPLTGGAPPLLVAGPPGAGKTLTVARLASRLVLAGAAPLVITADGTRAGATEQLAAFTRLLGIDLIVARTPKMLSRALTRRVAGAPVLIDAPGTDAFDMAQQDVLRELTDVAQATIALVLPAGLDPVEAGEVATEFRQIAECLLVANRLDGARRLGGILAAASAGLAFTEAGIGPGAADGLIPMTPEFLASRLMQFPDSQP